MTAEHNSNACREYEALLEDYLDGCLSLTSAQGVSAHLAVCRACHEALANARVSARLLALRRQPAGDPDSTFVPRLMGAIRAQEERQAAEKRFWRPLEVLAWRLVVSAVVAVVLLLAFGSKPRVSSGTDQTSFRRAEPRDIFSEPVQEPASPDEVLLMVAETRDGK